MKQPKSFEEGLTEAAGLISYCKQTLDAAKLQINEIDASLLAKAEDVQ